MLTALDFPDELLYSPHAVWVRDGGAGSARLGLNIYASLGHDFDCYMVKLPRIGAKLERGRPFGHVDLGRRTVTLVSPVTGTVLFPNPELRDEPRLLATDPYGRGFLLEVEGVDRTELEELFERDDACMYFSRADLAAPFGADQIFEPGRAWPTRASVRYGEKVVARARLLPPGGNEVFTPDWVLGDTWTVEVRPLPGSGAAPRRFAFEVLGDGRVGEDSVTRVRAVEVGDPGAPDLKPPFYRVLHYRIEDHTLVAWDEVSTGDPLATRRHFNVRRGECWIELEDAADGFILDHPKFPVSLDDEARDIPEGPAGAGKEPGISHYVKFRGGLTRVEAEMRVDIGTRRLLSSLVYQRGAPWWKEAARTIGSETLVRARLVD